MNNIKIQQRHRKLHTIHTADSKVSSRLRWPRIKRSNIAYLDNLPKLLSCRPTSCPYGQISKGLGVSWITFWTKSREFSNTNIHLDIIWWTSVKWGRRLKAHFVMRYPSTRNIIEDLSGLRASRCPIFLDQGEISGTTCLYEGCR